MRVRALQEAFPLAAGCLVLPFLHPGAASTLTPHLLLPETKCDSPQLSNTNNLSRLHGHLPSNLLLPLVLERTNTTTEPITPCPQEMPVPWHGLSPDSSACAGWGGAQQRQRYPRDCCIISATTGHLKAYCNIAFDMLKHRHFTSPTQTIKSRTEYS